MRPIFAVDAGQLFQVVWVSVASCVGVSILFSLVILSGARADEARRAGRGGHATLHLFLAIAAFALFAAGVIFGVKTMLTKS